MDETEALRLELEHYKAERERVKAILGQIGGNNSKREDAVVNGVFLVLVFVLFSLDVLREIDVLAIAFIPRFISLELALLLVSLKIIWMIHRQTKVDHFQFWILNSIEFRLNGIGQKIKNIEEKIADQ